MATSLAGARALILAGQVALGGGLAARRPTAGMKVSTDLDITLRDRPTYVSRGGEKLARALGAFGVEPPGIVALDIGASTGGFSDCLLQAGASRVYAVDVGYGQLATRLRDDPRVVSMERVNARNKFALPEPVDLIVVDVSFISLRVVLPPVFEHLAPVGRAIALLKPQFEARRKEVGKGGVVRDPQVHARVIARFTAWAIGREIRMRGLVSSPIEGASGNREFFVLLEPSRVRSLRA